MSNLTLEKTSTQELVKKMDLKHIAIIMDGNRRWAKKHNLPSAVGHKKGVDSLKDVLKACHKFGIKYLTVYAFSTENWKRGKDEVDFLMGLLEKTLGSELKELEKENVVLNFVGNTKELSSNLQEILKNATEKTKENKGVNLQIALNYGSRDEIKNAIKQIVKDGIKEEEINEELISKYLYTKNMPDPDLLIRTGGEMRISNYLLWQIAYSEILILDEFWPEFREKELANSILEFAKRQRRWGV